MNKGTMPDGSMIPPLRLEVSDATKNAIDAVKAAGGNVTCVYRTGLTLRHHVKPYLRDVAPADPQPPATKLLNMEKMKEKG